MRGRVAVGLGVLLTVAVLVAGAFRTSLTADGPTQTGGAAAQEERDMDHAEKDLAVRFPGAPEAVRSVARSIMAGGPVPPDELAALTPEALNAGYARALDNSRWDYRHTLLREAYVSLNPDAAAQLIAAGADPLVNDNELPFLAVQWRPKGELAFPDFSTENRLLALWLEAGGDPNAHNPAHGSLGPLLNKVPLTNLEGLILLLQAGADPWRRIMVPSTGSGPAMEAESFLEMQGPGVISPEVVFRLSRLNLFRPGPPDRMAEIAAHMDRAAAFVMEGSGPTDLGHQWRYHRAATAFIAATGMQPGPALRDLLARDPDDLAARAGDLAGFWLAPGETRSPDDPDQRVLDDQQNGTELWHE